MSHCMFLLPLSEMFKCCWLRYFYIFLFLSWCQPCWCSSFTWHPRWCGMSDKLLTILTINNRFTLNVLQKMCTTSKCWLNYYENTCPPKIFNQTSPLKSNIVTLKFYIKNAKSESVQNSFSNINLWNGLKKQTISLGFLWLLQVLVLEYWR